MRLPTFLHTIKFQVAAMAFATGVLAALGTAQLVLDGTEDGLRALLLANDRQDREQTAALLGSKLETVKQALLAVARQSQADVWRDAGTMERFLVDKPALGSLFDSVFAAAPDGRILARVEKGVVGRDRPNIAEREYFQQALGTDQVVVSRPLHGKISGLPLVIVAVSVAGAGETPRGVIAGSLLLQSNGLFTQPEHRAAATNAAELVIDRDGVILAHPRSDRLLGHAADEPGFGAAFARWRDSGAPIDLDASAVISQGHLVSMAGIPLSDWVHVRLAPEVQVMAPIRTARRAAWATAAGAGALAALLAAALGWRLVQPISLLRTRTQQLLDGHLSPGRDWPGGKGEVGAVARAVQLLLAQRDEQQAASSKVLRQLEAVLDNAEVGIALSRNGRFETVSRRYCEIFQCRPEQMVGQPTRMIHASDAAYEALSARAHPAFMADGAFEGEVELVRHAGAPFWARMRGRAVVPGERAHGTIWVVEDVTDTRHKREQLTWAASHDALTGLCNRAAFEALIDAAAATAAEQSFCALFIDLDRFKQVNDTAGHAAGDALLRGIALALSSRLRQTDTIARLGGDEFAALLPRCPAPRAREIAEGLRAAIAAYRLHWEGRDYDVGASIGLVVADGSHASAAEVMRAADAACYAAKRAGRNQVACAAPGAVDAPPLAPEPRPIDRPATAQALPA